MATPRNPFCSVKLRWSDDPIVGDAQSHKVTAWAGIYPVCNLVSYPLRFSKKETLADYEMSEEEIRAKLAELNPIFNFDGLAKNKAPPFSYTATKMALCRMGNTPDCFEIRMLKWVAPVRL